MAKRKRGSGVSGFTLIEMMVVIAIIGLLAGLIMAGLKVAQRQSTNTKARHGVAQLKTAWETFLVDYKRFPDIGANSKEGAYVITGQDVLQILRGREDYKVNGVVQNPRKLSYMDFHQNATQYLDPWGKPFRMALDTDYDGKVTAMGQALRGNVVVWSAGEDGEDGTDDDVTSWRKE